MSTPHKRNRQPGDSPPAKEGKSAYLCVTCNKNAEADCVECDWCGQWEHRECAGLSKEELKVLYSINSNVKFFCKLCNPKVEIAFQFFNDMQKKQDLINNKVKTIEETLSSTVSDLNSRLEQISNQLKQHPATHQQLAMQSSEANSQNQRSDPATVPTSNALTNVHKHSADRKFNVVIYGVKENPTGTARSTRAKSDIESCVQILKQTNDEINYQSIRDCIRLGRFDSSRPRPRPLLVKLSRVFDVTTVLYNRSKVTDGIQIKPDMNREEKLRESLLLKERWSLICSGIDKKLIKIRGSKLYVKGQLHGEITNSVFNPRPNTVLPNSASNNNSEMELDDGSTPSSK